jgi:hypothetical protein
LDTISWGVCTVYYNGGGYADEYKRNDYWLSDGSHSTGLISVYQYPRMNDIRYGLMGLDDPIPPPGYAFRGWYTAQTDGTRITPTTLLPTQGNQNLPRSSIVMWAHYEVSVGFPGLPPTLPSYELEGPFYVGDTGFLGTWDGGDNPYVTNGAPIEVIITGTDGTDYTLRGYLAPRTGYGHGHITITDPIPPECEGPDRPIVIIVNPGDPEGETTLTPPDGDRVDIFGKDDAWQWVRVRTINLPQDAADTDFGNVIMTWDREHIKIVGDIRYIVYTSDTLMDPVSEWTPVDERTTVRGQEEIIVNYYDVQNKAGDTEEWHKATMIDRGKETARFFKVKAVKFNNP